MSQGFTSPFDFSAAALTGMILAPNVVISSLTAVGALDAGSIVAGFSGIDGTPIGAGTPDAGDFTDLAASGALAVTGVTTHSADVDVKDGANVRIYRIGDSVNTRLRTSAGDDFLILNSWNNQTWVFERAGGLIIPGNLNALDTGPHAIGGAVSSRTRFGFLGSYVSGGSGTRAEKVRISGSIQGVAGDITSLSGLLMDGNIDTQSATESIGVIAQAMLFEPTIGDNLTGNINVAATLFIADTPTEGLVNGAFHIASGAANMLGDVGIGALASPTAFGLFGPATTAKASARLPHGSAPTSPVDGDHWTTTSGAFVRINGVTKQFAFV